MGVYRVLLLISFSINLVYSVEQFNRNRNITHESQEYFRHHYYRAMNYEVKNHSSTNHEKRMNDTQTFANQKKSNYRQGRESRIISPVTNQANGYYPPPPEYSHYGQDMYNPIYMPLVEEVSNVIEAPLYPDSPHPDDYEEDAEHKEITIHLPEEPEVDDDDDDPESSDEEESTELTTTTEATPTTTLAPFTMADVKVPAPFLRIEYMISFTFFGIMYGLGFFVLFQSLCVPAAKIAVYIVYMALLTLGVVKPVTLEQALEQLPPT